MAKSNEIKVGDYIGFKCDIEQYCEVTGIAKTKTWDGKWTTVYTVKAGPDGFDGEYIRGQTHHEVDEDDVFAENF